MLQLKIDKMHGSSYTASGAGRIFCRIQEKPEVRMAIQLSNMRRMTCFHRLRGQFRSGNEKIPTQPDTGGNVPKKI